MPDPTGNHGAKIRTFFGTAKVFRVFLWLFGENNLCKKNCDKTKGDGFVQQKYLGVN